jgi:hypothetical protein
MVGGLEPATRAPPSGKSPASFCGALSRSKFTFSVLPPPTDWEQKTGFAWTIFKGKNLEFGAENIPSGATLWE